MRNTRVTRQALSLATESTARNTYICRACLMQTSQQQQIRHASSEPFYKRIQNSLFGTKESKAAEAHRESARQKQLQDLKSATPEEKEAAREKVELHNGQVYEVAEIVDPATHADYVVSRDWKGMERVGGEEWVRRRADGGEKYVGFMPSKQVTLGREDWEALLHTVAAEVLALKKAGRDVLQVCHGRVFVEGGEATTQGIVVGDDDGKAVLKAGEKEKAILDSIPEVESAEERTPEALEMELQQALASSGGKMHMALKLDDPRVKLAVCPPHVPTMLSVH